MFLENDKVSCEGEVRTTSQRRELTYLNLRCDDTMRKVSIEPENISGG